MLDAPEVYLSVINEERRQMRESNFNQRDAIIATSRSSNTEEQLVSFHTKSSLEILIIRKQLHHKTSIRREKFSRTKKKQTNISFFHDLPPLP